MNTVVKKNLEAVQFLQQLTSTVHELFPGTLCIAEESTAWEHITTPTTDNGLGFDLKWNMGWMHDTLRYLGTDPIDRQGGHDQITFHQWYAYDEKWVLPLSHDEVVHGKGSLLDRMHGDYAQRLAQLRCLFAWQVAVPGRPLIFQGGEIGQGSEWKWNESIDWHESEQTERRQLCAFVSAVLHLYKEHPSLYVADDDRSGFRWVDCENRQESIIAFLRQAPGQRDILAVFNFTPVLRTSYPVGVPRTDAWTVLMNSDALQFGGQGHGPAAGASTDCE